MADHNLMGIGLCWTTEDFCRQGHAGLERGSQRWDPAVSEQSDRDVRDLAMDTHPPSLVTLVTGIRFLGGP
jgi:hypothetical protein